MGSDAGVKEQGNIEESRQYNKTFIWPLSEATTVGVQFHGAKPTREDLVLLERYMALLIKALMPPFPTRKEEPAAPE